MKHFILILLMCSVVTTIEAREKWKPKYNEELIQMYEENEKLKEDMAAEYWKAVKKELKELNTPQGQARQKKAKIQKGLEICRSQLFEPLEGKATPTGQIYKYQHETEGGELYYLGETTQWSYLMPIIFIPFKSTHKIYCRPVEGVSVDGTIATEKSWILSYSLVNRQPGKSIIYFTPKTK